MNPIHFSISELLKKTLITLSHYQQVQLSVILAKDVLPIFEEKYPNDNRPRLAIEAAESWLADPSEENAERAREAKEAAWAAAWSTGWAAGWAARTAWAARAAWAAADDARAAAAWAAGWVATAAHVAVTAGSAYYTDHYSARSKFYKTIPDKQQFIEMLGRNK